MYLENQLKPRMAPFGKELFAKLASGNKPSLGAWLFLGQDAWYHAKRHQLGGKSVLVLPDGEAPENFIWPVQEIVVLIFDLAPSGCDEQLIKRLALQLLRSGALHVILSPAGDAPLVIFHHDKSNRGLGVAL